MTDIVEKSVRSRMMSGIRSKNSKPEMIVRGELHRRGYRFRLHGKKLPGSPDIVLSKWKTVIFVHGCYWHRHPGCKLAYPVKSNKEFWKNKFEQNIERDRKAYIALNNSGWRILIVWECSTRSMAQSELGEVISGIIQGDNILTEVPLTLLASAVSP